MRAARFPCTVEVLQQALHMPPTARIIAASMDAELRCVVLTVDDPALPESDEPHDVNPVVTRDSYRWDWGVVA